MVTTANAVFTLAVVWFVVHELDAVRNHEWRFFVARLSLDDETAYRAFTALHVPLFVGLLSYGDVAGVQVGLDAFLIVHGGLHLGLRNHPLLTFEGWFSGLWIYGGTLLGALHLVVLFGPG
ncbi:DUF6713 family protein [Salinigranum salinum]|uniref:DUF6713 family protein n=1 Tax=Salinigranum salinum TaxID=1364937 RepID=UPI001261184E|nr:DUF6713 family protein [Salinigranum salinum]